MLRAVDPTVAVGPLRSVAEMVSRQTAPHRLVMMTLTFFGVVAALLSGLGLYAVVALTSRMRRREYAVRMALGAGAPGVRWLVVRQALTLGLAGIGSGLALAWAGTRVLRGFLLGVEPMDAAAVAIAATAMLGVAVGSAYLPAREAARLDPADVLKAE
ncbi:MAG: FtsX-like permease family protein [Gemmatimonadales bacterium]